LNFLQIRYFPPGTFCHDPPAMKLHAFLFCLVAGISAVLADAKTWVGSGTSAWSTPENWEP
jgi:hypothetical protein